MDEFKSIFSAEEKGTLNKLDTELYNEYMRIVAQDTLAYNGCKLIVEIGVGNGASGAVALMCACPDAKYIGYEIDYKDTAKGVLSAYPNASVVVCDTLKLKSMPKNIDLFHIDGDHTFPGCYNDLELARKHISPKGVILVHDYSFHNVFDACVKWYGAHKDEFNKQLIIYHRQSILFWRKI